MDSDQNGISDEEMSIMLPLLTRRQRNIRNRPNHFTEWDEIDFVTRFRLSKASAYSVLELIAPHITHKTDWNNALSPDKMLLLTLRLYATGSMLITIADFCGVSKSTACRVIKIVSYHIALLKNHFIQFPNNPEELQTTKSKFFIVAKFPKVIGALDCTHVRILSPGGENAELFRNRKGFFSINVQTICDSDLQILDVVARWPGSTHDSTIFNNSRILARLDSGEFNDCLIVADSGYQNKSFVMTPLMSIRTPEENLYNESLIRTRNCVERSYGVWKRRFPILSVGIRLRLETVQSIIVATAVLHNLCCARREVELPALREDLENAVNFVIDVPHNRTNANSNNITRRILIDGYFKSLA